MWKSWFASVLMLLPAVPAHSAKLTQKQIQMLEAVTFVFSGIEDNSKDDTKLPPWRREITDKGLEYWRIGRNAVWTSDDKTNAILKKSKYMRYVMEVTSPKHCVFSIVNREEFSNGNSTTDFSAYSMPDDMTTFTVDLADAHTFKLESDGVGQPYLLIQGARAVCDRRGYCQNGWNDALSSLHRGHFEDREENARRRRAIAFIKKSCAGKPY